ncbi:uncharacterized protein LOC124443065 [Xenia sp. Carnegie-2017]|uniref:uncharacterized protein LOC124443065 n=1 Tax=Xenia sp. Carnegie-2017 TaxID=2897299 RepID=UPI001F03B839|nr:uncharacterized protein LOC124443065 [Xenia sp. Carnegie-2017]
MVLLGTNCDLKPIRTDHLVVYPYREKWLIADKLQFHKGNISLVPSSYVHLFYIEPKLETFKPEKFDQQISNEYDEETDIPAKKKRKAQRLSESESEHSDSFLSDICHDQLQSYGTHQISMVDDEKKTTTTKNHLSSTRTILVPISSSGNQEELNDMKTASTVFSVSDYVDTNRHDVQEQDIQELLRFQELATPADEAPAKDVQSYSNLQRVASSIKKIVFG